MSQQTSTKATRLTPCPPRLKRILDVLDLLPEDVELPDLSYLNEEPVEVIHKQLAGLLKTFPKAFARHIWTFEVPAPAKDARVFVDSQPEKVREKLRRRYRGAALPAESEAEEKAAKIIDRFADLTYDSVVRSALNKYRFIQQSGRNLRELGRVASECIKGEKGQLTSYAAFFAIDIDQKGIAHTHRNSFGEAVDGENLSRIRECVICSRLFWAGRDDKWCCSETCQRTKRNKDYQPNRPPAESVLTKVRQALPKLCRNQGWKQFQRTPENIRLLAEWADVRPKQCDNALNYLEQNKAGRDAELTAKRP